VRKVFEQKAHREKAPIRFADQEFRLRNVRHSARGPLQLVADVYRGRKAELRGLRFGLPGLYQQKNMVTVLAAVDELRRQGFRIPATAVRKGFAQVVALTGLLGRWQVLQRRPLTIADTGHNEAGIREVMQQLKRTKHRQLHVVFGVVNDKDPGKLLTLLPKKARYYFCAAQLPRALPPAELAVAASGYGLRGECYTSVRKAVAAARQNAAAEDLIYIGGSTFVVAEAL
jgi:dihydrofolate synthase / folylpolyglutamate synthase